MAVKLRLRRVGARNDPVWRVVVADQRSPRDGRVIETLGHYNPQATPSTVVIDRARADSWLARGAQPTRAVRKLLRLRPAGDAPEAAGADPDGAGADADGAGAAQPAGDAQEAAGDAQEAAGAAQGAAQAGSAPGETGVQGGAEAQGSGGSDMPAAGEEQAT